VNFRYFFQNKNVENGLLMPRKKKKEKRKKKKEKRKKKK
jgi:hypothetical protein